MRLNSLKDNAGANKNRMRVGRGIGSGKGKTGGRGVKGQKSRTGVAIKGFEGGQMPLHMRLPKRGFNVPNAQRYLGVRLDRIQAAIDAKKLDHKVVIDGDALVKAGVIKRSRDGIRLIAGGEFTAQKVSFKVVHASAGAVAAIEAAGGKVDMVGTKSEAQAARAVIKAEARIKARAGA
jgi:large subunit ribosomal protein L15